MWADDGHDKPWPTTVFVSREIPRTLGWFVLPELRRGFFDVVWVMLAEGTRTKRELPEVMIRHDNSMHPVAPDVIAADERVFNLWARDQAPQDIRKLRHALYS